MTLRQEAEAPGEALRFLAVQGNLLSLPQQAMQRSFWIGVRANSFRGMLVRELHYRACFPHFVVSYYRYCACVDVQRHVSELGYSNLSLDAMRREGQWSVWYIHTWIRHALHFMRCFIPLSALRLGNGVTSGCALVVLDTLWRDASTFPVSAYISQPSQAWSTMF